MVPEKVILQTSARNLLFISLRLSIFAADLNPPLFQHVRGNLAFFTQNVTCFSRRLTNEHKLFSQNARTRGPQHLLFQRGALWARVPTQTRPKPRADRRALQRRLRLRRQVRRALRSALRGTRRSPRPGDMRCRNHDGGRGCSVYRLRGRLAGNNRRGGGFRLPVDNGWLSSRLTGDDAWLPREPGAGLCDPE